MADPAKILDRVRQLGADIVVDGNRLFIANRFKLTPDAVQFVQRNAAEIARYLSDDQRADFEERAAIIEYEAGAPREWAEQFAQILISKKPANVDDYDWSWFLSACGRIIDEAPRRTI
ncbi:hypothetical protein [Brucella intermedia]|uniref:hypothetical protein n=1 Tax=Brucella intermedia TaxID=94625 RepID=UPI00124F615B|nr:hypothetical protein [Brucella intermedia]KAB2733609.1 hypothetical protein F9L02_01125 [Brucella intermedia]